MSSSNEFIKRIYQTNLSNNFIKRLHQTTSSNEIIKLIHSICKKMKIIFAILVENPDTCHIMPATLAGYSSFLKSYHMVDSYGGHFYYMCSHGLINDVKAFVTHNLVTEQERNTGLTHSYNAKSREVFAYLLELGAKFNYSYYYIPDYEMYGIFLTCSKKEYLPRYSHHQIKNIFKNPSNLVKMIESGFLINSNSCYLLKACICERTYSDAVNLIQTYGADPSNLEKGVLWKIKQDLKKNPNNNYLAVLISYMSDDVLEFLMSNTNDDKTMNFFDPHE